MEFPFLIFIGFALLALLVRLAAGSFDKGRVEEYIRKRGGKLLDCSWNPLGPGWFGEKDSRIYAIVYRDRDGTTWRADVKTSMLSGVYLTNEQKITAATPQARRTPGAPRALSISEEKERLRRRLAELEAMEKIENDEKDTPLR